MRYFKHELWSGINSESEKTREEAYAEWKRNEKEYLENFKLVRDGISKKFYHCFAPQKEDG